MTIQYYKVGKTGKPAYRVSGLTDANCRQSVELQAARYAGYMLANELKTATVWRTSDHATSDNYRFRQGLYAALYKHHTGVDTTRTTYQNGTYFVFTLCFMRGKLEQDYGYNFRQWRPDDNGGHINTGTALS